MDVIAVHLPHPLRSFIGITLEGIPCPMTGRRQNSREFQGGTACARAGPTISLEKIRS